MTWVKLDDRFTDNPKLSTAGPLAGWLYVSGLCYCAGNLTDGLIPKAKAKILVDIPAPAKHIKALIDAGLWVDEGAHYRVHDYLEYQPSRASVEIDRAKAKKRMADARAAKEERERSGEQEENVPANFDGTSDNPLHSTPLSSVSDPTHNSGLGSDKGAGWDAFANDETAHGMAS